MERKLKDISLSDEKKTFEVNRNISVLSEIVNSLISAASALQTMKDSETNFFFKNLEMRFPEDGIDYHKAKKLYEINLVKQALRQTDGHQTKAAKLLNLNTTTLNSIIKRHKISY